jgi:CheY-like chemotaxis protein
MTNDQNLTILITEDDDGHADLIKEGLKDAGVRNPMIRFSNGLEVWEFLQKNKNLVNENEKKYLLLLDIKMPMMDGVEVLKSIKEDDVLKLIPVIMLTTTDDPREIDQCYQYGCNVYIKKPISFQRFAETLKRLGLFVMIVTV